MIELYVGCFIVGMGLLAASFVSDHDTDADVDHDLDFDADADVDIDIEHDLALDGAPAATSVDAGEALWLPILSLRFWIFFAAFFGLTGILLHLLHDNGTVVLAVALAMGFGCGYTASRIVRALRADTVNSAVDPATDYVGRRGTVLLGIAPGDPGQVRLHVKGIDVDLTAVVDDGVEPLERGATVLVTEYRAGTSTLLVQPFSTGTSGRLEQQRETA